MAYALCAVPGVKASRRVVTISKYVREQAEKHFHLHPSQVNTIYNGVKTLHPISIPRQAGPRYLLCVNSLQPHKNLVRMIKAYLLVKQEHPDLELHVVGRPQPRFAGDKELCSFLASPGVKVLGYLSEDDLASAYARATVFCYPSLEEGFGLPVLEAMSIGSLVLTSNVSCLPEISGPSVELVDPLSVSAITAGLRRLLALSDAERANRIRKGKRWAAKFSWQAAAQAYLNIYEELLA
jgi:glycosyltransferase involved in cell wall biosynthesis